MAIYPNVKISTSTSLVLCSTPLAPPVRLIYRKSFSMLLIVNICSSVYTHNKRNKNITNNLYYYDDSANVLFQSQTTG